MDSISMIYAEFEEDKRDREWYKMKVGDTLQAPRRKADLIRNLEYANENYVVDRPILPARIMLGMYGLIISMCVGFCKGINHIANALVVYEG